MTDVADPTVAENATATTAAPSSPLSAMIPDINPLDDAYYLVNHLREGWAKVSPIVGIFGKIADIFTWKNQTGAIALAILWAWLCFWTRSFILNGPFVIAAIILYTYYNERLNQIELQRQMAIEKEKHEQEAKAKENEEEEHSKAARESGGIIGSGLHFVGHLVDKGVSLGTRAVSGALGVGKGYLGLPAMIQDMDKKVVGLNNSLGGLESKLEYIDLTKEERRFPVAATLVGGWIVWRIINHFLPFRWIAFIVGEAVIFAGSGIFSGGLKAKTN